MQTIVETYFKLAGNLPLKTQVSLAGGQPISLTDGFQSVIGAIEKVKSTGRTLRVIGNGGSAAIASHMCVDFAKRGGVRTQDMNAGPMLTCLGNDFGYADVFSRQIQLCAEPDDMLVAISSSGNSKNILKGVAAATAAENSVITFSGFRPDNSLRAMGTINFFVDSPEYGFVELTHMALLSSLVDIFVGWHPGRVLGR